MSIEASSTSNVTRPGSSNDSRGAKGKQSQGAEDGGSGFMAVLASVDAPKTPQEPSSKPTDTTGAMAQGNSPAGKPQPKAKADGRPRGDASADAARAKDAATSQEASVAAAVEPAADAALPDEGLPVDPAAAAAAAAALALLQDATVGAASAEPMSGVDLLAQSAAWMGGMPGGSVAGGAGGVALPEGQADVAGQVPATTGGLGSVTLAGAGPRAAAAGQGVSQVAAPVSSEAAPEGLQDGLKKAVNALAEPKAKAPATGALPEPQVPSDGKAGAAGGQKWMDSGTTPLSTALAQASAGNGATLLAPLQREDLPRERTVFRSTASDNAIAHQAQSTPAPTLTVSGTPEVIPATDAFVAEKVSYWITNNIQNAEMKLEGVGDRPVEVSIRLQGNEAQVAFRTDELQTRAALESASAHLKELLQKEGLVLSGVSVGTAGTGGSGAQDRKSRQGERQGTVAALQPLTGELRPLSSRAASGGLDLFV